MLVIFAYTMMENHIPQPSGLIIGDREEIVMEIASDRVETREVGAMTEEVQRGENIGGTFGPES